MLTHANLIANTMQLVDARSRPPDWRGARARRAAAVPRVRDDDRDELSASQMGAEIVLLPRFDARDDPDDDRAPARSTMFRPCRRSTARSPRRRARSVAISRRSSSASPAARRCRSRSATASRADRRAARRGLRPDRGLAGRRLQPARRRRARRLRRPAARWHDHRDPRSGHARRFCRRARRASLRARAAGDAAATGTGPSETDDVLDELALRTGDVGYSTRTAICSSSTASRT